MRAVLIIDFLGSDELRQGRAAIWESLQGQKHEMSRGYNIASAWAVCVQSVTY